MRRDATLGLPAAAILVLAGFWTLLGTASAEPVIGELLAGDISGKVVDPEMRPVAGATVWLAVTQADGDPRVVAKTVSDGEGQFHFAQVDWKPIVGVDVKPILVAKDAGGRLGGRTLWTPGAWSSWDVDEEPCGTVVHLQDVEKCEGRVVDLAGKPVAGAKVRPSNFFFRPAFDSVSAAMALAPEVADELTTQTDAEGRFVLQIPAQAYAVVEVSEPGHGRASESLMAGKAETIRLGPPTTVQGKVICNGGSGPAARIRLCATVESEGGVSGGAKFTVSREDGSFQFDGLRPGKCTVTVLEDGTQPYYGSSPAEVEVKADETVSGITVMLDRAMAVRGRVVDRKTGDGIPAVLVNVFSEPTPEESLSETTMTDARGEYCVYVRPGKIRACLVDLESDVVPSLPETSTDCVLTTEDLQYPPMETDRPLAVEGIVVDEQGNPVPRADVFVTRLSGTKRKHLRSDEQGKFTVPKVPPSETCGLCARTDRAASAPRVEFVPEKVTEPLRVVVSEKQACTVRGACVDQAGKPVPNAEIAVSVWSETPDVFLPVAWFYRSWKSDANGQFTIPGLWTGLKVDVDFDAVNHDEREISMPALPQGEHDLGKVVLAALDGAIEGIVCDSQGRPVAGAKVFNRGDAPLDRLDVKEVASVTDAAGRFRLQGFRPGWAYVFVEKEGCRLAAVRAAVGATDVKVTLLGSDEPVPARPSPELPSPADQQKLARKIFEQLITTDYSGNRLQVMEAMGRIDPQTVLKWAETADIEKPLCEGFAALGIADSDLDEAMSLLEKNDDGNFELLTMLARRYETADPAKALRCAEEMVVRARALDQPKQAEFLANAATRVIRAGEKESGRKLAQEAADMVATIPENLREWSLVPAVAEALGACDLEGAARFAEAVDKGALSTAISAASFEELSKAEAMLKQWEAENKYEAVEVRARLAHRLAATHPEDALRIVNGMGLSAMGLKVMLLGRIAVAVAPYDRAAACSLLDQALSYCVQPPEDVSFDFGHRAILAGLLALQAQRIDYPDMESVVARVLAARDAELNDSDAGRLAAILAPLDPQASRHLLEIVAAARQRNPDLANDQSCELAAWVLVDWEHAEERVEREFAVQSEKKDDRDYQNDCDYSALLFAAQQLSFAEEDRWEYYERRFLDTVLSEVPTVW